MTQDDDEGLRARLDTLSKSLDGRSDVSPDASLPTGADPAARGRALSLGARILSEFIAAVVVGGFVGWELDAWIGSGPWLFVLFLFLGLAAGFWNVYRIATRSATT